MDLISGDPGGGAQSHERISWKHLKSPFLCYSFWVKIQYITWTISCTYIYEHFFPFLFFIYFHIIFIYSLRYFANTQTTICVLITSDLSIWSSIILSTFGYIYFFLINHVSGITLFEWGLLSVYCIHSRQPCSCICVIIFDLLIGYVWYSDWYSINKHFLCTWSIFDHYIHLCCNNSLYTHYSFIIVWYTPPL